MHILAAVAQKIGKDKELLSLLKASDPNAQIIRSILLTLNRPEVSKRAIPEEERTALITRMKEVARQAEEGFARIEGLKVHNLMDAIGHASISGTAQAVVNAINLDCVKHAILGDKPFTRGTVID
jgi:hypothetical protein